MLQTSNYNFMDPVAKLLGTAYCEANRPGLRSKTAAFRF